ncbi:MAG TPA: MerR family transcriptional regulator [Phenylobacterium sp.]|jgi:DNA-binding transcriptional MerR regulator|nr:MerR family transcriptional regulator [Phenylobacterium sp.]
MMETPISVRPPASLRAPAGVLATIGDLSDLFGLTPRAIRHYEDRGLLRPVRDSRNRRRFGMEDRQRLNVIVLLRRAGAPIPEIAALFERAGPDLRRHVASLLDARERQLEADLFAVRAARAEVALGLDV